MAYTTSQQLNKYYSLYKDINITFTNEVIAALNFDPKQAFVRYDGEQWPCIINSASMRSAKIICGKGTKLMEKLQEGLATINIRFTFFASEGNDKLSFFVSTKLEGISDYEVNGNTFMMISLTYTQRAPDDLIDKLGSLIEANVASKKRRNERILLTQENRRRINLEKTETVVFIDSIPRRCILRDISFSGVKILIAGVANFLINKEVTVRFSFEDPRSVFGIKGRTVRYERIEGRKDLVAVAIAFHEESMPMIFKMYLNRYFSVVKKPAQQEELDAEKEENEKTESSSENNSKNKSEDGTKNESENKANEAQVDSAETASSDGNKDG